MFGSDLFVRPTSALYTSPEFDLGDGYGTYTYFNYLRPGIIPRLKRYRFELALWLARSEFGRGGAIDFGCADGVLVPSLARYFPEVAAVDSDEGVLRLTRQLVRTLQLQNVRVVNNARMDVAALRETLAAPARVLFLLETLEHVGERERLYPSKIEFLRELFTLLERDGVIVISVPKMVGLPFLVKYGVQRALGLPHEPQTLRALIKSAVLKNTDDLEPRWDGRHNGFNNEKLASHLRAGFDMVARQDMFFSEFFVVRQRSGRR